MPVTKPVKYFILLASVVFLSHVSRAQKFYASGVFPNTTLEMDVSNNSVTELFSCEGLNTFLDIALDLNGNIYYSTGLTLYRRNINSNICENLGTIYGAGVSSLVADKDGIVYGALWDQIIKYDPATGIISIIGKLPFGMVAAGDLFFYEGRLFLTCMAYAEYRTNYLTEVNIAHPELSCFYMDLPGVTPYGAFSINFPSSSKVYVIGPTNALMQSELREVDMEARTLGPVIRTYPYLIYGAASEYHYNQLPITPLPAPLASITASANNVCSGTEITFTCSASNAVTPAYYWKKHGVPVGSNAPSYSDHSLADGDRIKCTVTSGSCSYASSGSSNTEIMHITPLIAPSVSVVASAYSICPSVAVTFKATAVNGGPTPVYQWKKNGVLVGVTDTYTDNTLLNRDVITCELTANENCMISPTATSDPVSITVTPNPTVSLDHFPEFCKGESRLLDAGNFTAYLWNNGSGARTLNVNDTGTYYVTVWNNNGCTGSDTTRVTALLPLPSGFLPADTAICSDDELLLQCSSTYSAYNWNNGSGNSFLVAKPSGLYWLEVTDKNQCKGRDTVIVSSKECLRGFFMPNTFSPNNDGKNDLFKPVILGKLKKYSLSVYNRWGALVFHTTNVQQGWDGSFSGANQGSGVFVWVCSYQLGDQSYVKKGTVLLTR